MEDADGSVTLRMSQAEAIVLHVTIAGAEFENELGEIELRHPLEQKVISDVQQALVPVIPGLGTDGFQGTVDRAYAVIDPTPY